MGDISTITDPAAVLIGLGAIAGVLASWAWAKVWASIRPSDAGAERVRPRHMDTAAFLTSAAFGLVSVGYLFGQFAGRF